MRINWIVALIGLVTLATATPTRAGIVTTTGSLDIIAAPANVNNADAPQSNTRTMIFFERNTTLASNLALDASGPGSFTTAGSLNGGTVPAGTNVNSYMLFSNPSTGTRTYDGSVTFSERILGVEVTIPRLNDTDNILGSLTTAYQKGTSRGLEFETDSFTIDALSRSVAFHFVTSTAVDEIRIVTATTATPEPATLVAALVGVSLAAARIRRRGTIA